MKTYLLSQKYFALSPFSAEGTLEELADIITASGGEITHLDDSHHGPGQFWEEPATGYDGPGWYYKIRDIDESFTKANSLEDAIRQVGSHDTSEFSLTPTD
jgi:hypothetical protein